MESLGVASSHRMVVPWYKYVWSVAGSSQPLNALDVVFLARCRGMLSDTQQVTRVIVRFTALSISPEIHSRISPTESITTDARSSPTDQGFERQLQSLFFFRRRLEILRLESSSYDPSFILRR